MVRNRNNIYIERDDGSRSFHLNKRRIFPLFHVIILLLLFFSIASPLAAQTPCSSDIVTSAPSFNISTGYGAPITWTHNVPPGLLGSVTYVGLYIEAYDVDYPSSTEYDRVYFNGHDLGLLQGQPDTWVTVEKTVPISYVNEGSNTVQVYVDIDNAGWVTTVRRSELRFYCSFPVSGTVTDGSNPIQGVVITFSHDGHTEITNASGNYSYTVVNGVNTTITPSHTNYHGWTPSSRNITVTGTVTNQDFQGVINTPPIVTTSGISGITHISASGGGNVTYYGGTTVTARGVCWNTSPNPTIANSKSIDGGGTGVFTSAITSLTPGTTYYVRAYATNSSGTSYGGQVSFTTIDYPTVTTSAISNITHIAATGGGNVPDDGGATVTAKGVCWNTSPNPTIANTKTNDGTGTGSFVSSISGLTQGTTYYVRAYATNSVGTAYGNEVSFVTDDLPDVTTTAVANVTHLDAQGGGNVTADNGATVTARGVCWSTSANPTIADANTSDGTGTGAFSSSIIGLTRGTTYYVRAYATNAVGTSYGSQVSFLTDDYADVTTTSASSITHLDAVSGGNVTADNGATVTARGVCWSTSPTPTTADNTTGNGTGTGIFSSTITGLTRGTTYYARAYAVNAVGTAYGSEISFLTDDYADVSTLPDVTDITHQIASSGGEVTAENGAVVTSRGVCWSTSPTPTVADSKTDDGTGTGAFTSAITGLRRGTTYYVRAYAVNAVGDAYGDEVSFLSDDLPTVTTAAVTDITSGTASGNGEVVAENGDPVTQRGIVWSRSAAPTVYTGTKVISGNGLGTFTAPIAGLTRNTKYYVRAYAINNVGVAYGEDVDFMTNNLPAVTTAVVTDITGVSATLGGEVTDDGRDPVVNKGVCWSTQPDPTTESNTITGGSGLGLFTVPLSGLTPGTTYYVKAYAINETGIGYGSQETFTTLTLPTVSTSAISDITATGAVGGGTVVSDGGATVTVRGVCWDTASNPTVDHLHTEDGIGSGSFTSTLSGLTPGTSYFVRAYAVNSQGIAYGDNVTFVASENPAISGQVTYNDAGLADVTLSFSNDGGTAVTSGDGHYIKVLPYGWSGTVTAEKTGYTMTPAQYSFSNLQLEKKNQDFEASAVPLEISGHVMLSSTGGSNQPLGGVNMVLNPDPGLSTADTTDSSGAYTLQVYWGWSGTVTPELSGYTFSPEQVSYETIASAKTNQDYSAFKSLLPTHTISGRVSTTEGEALEGVVLTFSANAGYALTDEDGSYSHEVEVGWSGSVSPSMRGYVFTPRNRSYNDVQADFQDQDYSASTAPVIISGRIEDEQEVGVPGTELTFTTAGTGESSIITSDFNGMYRRTVPKGWSGSVTPAKYGYTFEPVELTYENLNSGKTEQNFIAIAPANVPVVRGSITNQSGIGISGIDVLFQGQQARTAAKVSVTTSTDANGNFQQPVESGWSGSVQPTNDAYEFEPASRRLTNVTSDVTVPFFLGNSLYPVISGTVATGDGVGVPSVLLEYSGSNGVAGQTYTNNQGQYIFVVPPGWTGTVAPFKEGFGFQPQQLTFQNIAGDTPGQDILALSPFLFITGVISGTDGNPLAEVTVTFATGSDGSGGEMFTSTDDTGTYVQPLPANWTGIVTPFKEKYDFEPPQRTYENLTATQHQQNYSASEMLPVISGRVTRSTKSGISGLDGVVLNFSNDGGSTVTDYNGDYSHSVPMSWNGTVTPDKEGYVFFPGFLSFVQVVEDRDRQNFSASNTSLRIRLEAQREAEQAIAIRKYYGHVSLTLQSLGEIEAARYVIKRSEDGGTFEDNYEIPGSSLDRGDTYSYNDYYLEQNKKYTYKAFALDSAGNIIGASNEEEI